MAQVKRTKTGKYYVAHDRTGKRLSRYYSSKGAARRDAQATRKRNR